MNISRNVSEKGIFDYKLIVIKIIELSVIINTGNSSRIKKLKKMVNYMSTYIRCWNMRKVISYYKSRKKNILLIRKNKKV